ncbi:hypothetical protein E5D57_008265 [Metarhizium anisopliae]|nr:hypothetical protein E5D57_008265 [Metarhizium anisopliae]
MKGQVRFSLVKYHVLMQEPLPGCPRTAVGATSVTPKDGAGFLILGRGKFKDNATAQAAPGLRPLATSMMTLPQENPGDQLHLSIRTA